MLEPVASVSQPVHPASAAMALLRPTRTAAATAGASSDGTFAQSLLDARSAVLMSDGQGSPPSTASSAWAPGEELLAAVRSRALAAGLHPSTATVYRTAVLDLARSAGSTIQIQPPSRDKGLSSTYETPNPNQVDGIGYVRGGTTPGVAPATPVDLSAPSPDTQTYTQQLFALEADPAALAVARASSAWPTEATNDAWRRQTLIQFVSAEVGAGPYYNPTTSLTNAQVIAAQSWSQQSPALNLNPTYAAALFRASEVARSARAATSTLPWNGQDATVELLADGSFGTTPVSGFYGTGLGSPPAA